MALVTAVSTSRRRTSASLNCSSRPIRPANGGSSSSNTTCARRGSSATIRKQLQAVRDVEVIAALIPHVVQTKRQHHNAGSVDDVPGAAQYFSNLC